MAILIRRAGEEWRRIGPASYTDEAHLQKMLYDSPELIPLPGGDNLARVFVREAGLQGSGNTDLLGTDDEGNIYLVECKLAANREIRRQVIGQVLEYAAFLWGISFEEFDGLFVGREGKSLAELFEGKVQADWSFDLFTEAIDENLSRGRFHLIIVVDEINPELERIIQYVSQRGEGFRLEMLELKLYAEGNTEVLVPDLHGRITQPARAISSRNRSLDEVLAACETDTVRTRLKLLVDRWIDLGNFAKTKTSGISFRARVGDNVRSIFWAQTPNIATVVFTRLLSQGAPPELIGQYREQVAEIGGFDPNKVRSQRAPRAQFSKMSEADVKTFVQVNQELVEAWRNASTG